MIKFLPAFLILFGGGLASVLRPRRFLVPALVLTLAWPSGWRMAATYRWSGIYGHDGFYLGVLFGVAFLLLMRYRPWPLVGFKYTSAVVFILVFIFLALYKADYRFFRHYLLDLRFAILPVQVLFASRLLFSLDPIKRRRVLDYIVIANGIVDFILFCMRATHEYGSGAMPRYLDSSTIIAAFYLSFIWRVRGDNKRLLPIVMAGLTLLISGSRVFLLLTALWKTLELMKYVFKSRRGVLSIVTVVLIVVLVGQLWGISERARSLEHEILMKQVVSRFFPFFLKWSTMSDLQKLFGAGTGAYFFIPWFMYWGFNPFNPTMDSFYGTLVVKYGILMGPILVAVVILALERGRIRFRGMYPWLILLGLTQAIPWHHQYNALLMIGALRGSWEGGDRDARGPRAGGSDGFRPRERA